MIANAEVIGSAGEDRSCAGPVQIGEFTASDQRRWDAFVEQCPEATFFHYSAWRSVIHQAFGHEPYYLYAERDGSLEGILPLTHIKSRLFGNALISAPFCVYGGVAAQSADARSALDLAARSLAERLGVDYLEYRNRDRSVADLTTKDLYVTFRKELYADPEENLRAIPRKQRAVVRKGIKANLKSDWDDELDRFYAAYSESVRNLGTPVFSKTYFRILKDAFGDRSDILTVTYDGRAISSVMNFYFRDEVLPYYGGGTQEARHLKANDFMYWELMRRSCERGIRIFDYGRSKVDSGSYSFKKNWGFVPEPLYYQYHLVKAKTLPDISPMNPKYRLFIGAWKRLPVSVTNVLGPVISRNLG